MRAPSLGARITIKLVEAAVSGKMLAPENPTVEIPLSMEAYAIYTLTWTRLMESLTSLTSTLPEKALRPSVAPAHDKALRAGAR